MPGIYQWSGANSYVLVQRLEHILSSITDNSTAMALPSFPLHDGTLIPAVSNKLPGDVTYGYLDLGLTVAVTLLASQIGFGTGTKWYKEDGKGPLNQDLVHILKTAISSGFTHIDAAEAYGTEEEVGIAIKESSIPREKLFVTTKVLESVDDIDSAINNSLQKLQLDYVDMYQPLPLLAFHHLVKCKSDSHLAGT